MLISGECLGVTYDDETMLGARDRDIHSPQVRKEPNVPFGIASYGGEDHYLLLAALPTVNSFHVRITKNVLQNLLYL